MKRKEYYWGLYTKTDPWNIMPTDEQEEHSFDTTCKCHPKVIEENGQMIVIHNSFDCREIIEQVKEILKV